MKNTAQPVIPTSHAPEWRYLYFTRNEKVTLAIIPAEIHASGPRRIHGETMSAVVAVKPASTRSARVHLFCHNGQRTKNGATNNSCPLSIAPAASKQPQQNQRFFNAASAAKR